MRRLVLAPLILAACSDFNLHNRKSNEGTDPGDSGYDPNDDTDGDGLCDAPNTEPQDVGIDESCEIEEVGTFTPVIKWQNTDVGDAYATPVVGQLTDDNGDGKVDSSDTPDIVISNAVGVTYALRGSDGKIEWSAGNMGGEPATPAIGDLDADGWPDVVAAGSAGIQAFRGRDGSAMWTGPAYRGSMNPACGAVGIYDLNADGKPEVVFGGTIMSGKNGTLIGMGRGGEGSGHGWAAPMGVAADIDQDGQMEVVVGNALFTRDGTTIWSNGQTDGFVAIGNFDNDDKGEIVVTYTGDVRLQDDDGTVIWSQRNVTGDTSGPPTIADYDGDGEPEIGVAGHNVYVVFETDGSVKWRQPVHDESSGFTGSAVFDFEGDGKAEVVYADENDLLVFDGATGAVKLQESAHSSATCSEYPSIADVDNDGHAEIIYSSSAYSGSERGVTVVGDADNSWMPGRPVWNQHAYAITNVSDLGIIPKNAATNWLTYNNFRSGDLAASTGGATGDAIPVLEEICNIECEAGKLRVVVNVGNRGLDDIPAGVVISAYANESGAPVFLASKTTAAAIKPGESSEGLIFKLDADDVNGGTLEFRSDDDNGAQTLAECNEDNNVMIVEDDLCE